MFHETNVVTKEISIPVPPTKVYLAWTEPEHLTKWFTDEVKGWPGVGSELAFTWKNFGFSVNYKIAELRPDEKVVYKTRLPGVGTQVLTVTLARRAPRTIVTVSEAGPENHKSDPYISGVDSGWAMTLGLLKLYVEDYYGKTRERFFAMLPAQFEYETLRRLYSTTEGLKEWLIVEGEAATEPDQQFCYTLDSGETMSGRVMAISHHEILWSWKEIEGYLELKSFPTSGDNKGLVLRGATYMPAKFAASEIEVKIKDILVKLFAAVVAGSAKS
jgi:uncharacterized protein YndB with AHSA1/START domain